MKRFTLMAFTSLILLFLAPACSEDSQHQDHHATDQMDHQEGSGHMNHSDHMDHGDHMEPNAAPASGAGNLSQAQKILATYLEVKDALVQTDGTAAQAAAGELLATVGEADDELIVEIRRPARAMAETENTEEQREHFFSLSQAMYALLQATEANEAPVYR